jgi:mono/diheme cytochrome c family protein
MRLIRLLASGTLFPAALVAQSNSGPESGPELAAPFFEKYCLDCHDSDSKKGGLDLSALQFGSDQLPTWIKIHDAVAQSEMPPKKKSQPGAEERSEFAAQLDQRIFTVSSKESGHRLPLRRMTRKEFENSLRDLLDLPRLDITALLPIDGRVSGYDKIAGGLDISSAHLAAYEEAVEKALDAAIATRSTPPPVFKRRVYPAGLFKFKGNLAQGQFVLLKDKNNDPALPVRGGFEDRQGHVGDAGPDLAERAKQLAQANAEKTQSSVGLLNPNLAGYEAALDIAPIYAGLYRMKTSVWGFHWNKGNPEPCEAPQAAVLRAHAEGHQQEGGRLLATLTAPSMVSQEHEFTSWIDSLESLVFDPVSVPWTGLRVGQVAGRAAKHVGPGVALDWFEIEGPLHSQWPPESHRRLFGDLPIQELAASEVAPPKRTKIRSLGGFYMPTLHSDLSPKDRNPPLESVCSNHPLEDGQKLLAAFLPRAFRRDVAPAEIIPYLNLLKTRLAAKECFEDAMRRVYVAVLTSPEFLFLAPEHDNRTLFSKASRLSFWLWNSPPDSELLSLARNGSLARPAVLHAQIDRLLNDPNNTRFIEDFSNQWLELNRLDETTPDRQLYPEHRFLLQESLGAETRGFLTELIRENRPARDLLKPGFAMLTQRLAEHYGIPGVSGVEVRKVNLPPDSLRGGLLGQAAIHKLTANGTTTSPVKRGLWVMDRLLNDPAPPPPPGVSQIDPDTRGASTVREQLSRHRSDPNCSACHSKIDPAGFALEAFDPIGGFRTRYRSNGKGDPTPADAKAAWRATYKLGPQVDPSGELRDGRAFSGPGELVDHLSANPEKLATAFVAHLCRYATGSDIRYSDRREIARIVESCKPSGYGLRSLIHALAESPLFTPHTP